MENINRIAAELSIPFENVKHTADLLKEGATLPFIARYRKEQTGALDELQIAAIQQSIAKHEALEQRKMFILKAIDDLGKLSPELKANIEAEFEPAALEDYYLPYKSKRKTKADSAKEKGLQGLAAAIMKGVSGKAEVLAEKFLNKEVKSIDGALSGAMDIIAEWINENQYLRNKLRHFFRNNAVLKTKAVKNKLEESDKYRDYLNYSEKANKIPSHRFLAITRAEAEGFIKVDVSPDEDSALELAGRILKIYQNPHAPTILKALKDSWKRLLKPSLATELKNEIKEKSDDEAVRIFANNLNQLLLAAPVGGKRTLAIDPGFRSGCKLVCLDEQGELLHNETIYPHAPQKDYKKAASKLTVLLNAYKIEAIAVGNGTAGKETEQFIRRLKFEKEIKLYSVNEDGASVYSASSVAREEFPNYDVTVRGAVSIGRRLMDPLTELVKIDPQAIGVGQYQHDVNQKKLKQGLDQTVENAVNRVGAEVNRSGKYLLTYIAGLGAQTAANIVEYRKENGAFTNRKQLLKVPRLGPKVFEQCAGFLRIAESENPLDKTGIHPEKYALVNKIAKSKKCSAGDLLGNKELLDSINWKDFADESTGMPTLEDIHKELINPGRDPRKSTGIIQFSDKFDSIKNLPVGITIWGIVTNVTNFGAFVDIGIKENGLVHISHLADDFVKDPFQVVAINQKVKVKVLEVDPQRKRIALSIKDAVGV